MAYLQQNPIDQLNQSSSQVLGPNGQQPQQPQQVGPSGESAFIGATPSAGQVAPQAPTTAKKASSGQFTNLRSYIQANQGAGQKMSQTVTKDLSKQAQQVGASLDKQKQRYESQVQEQQQQLNKAQQQAQQTIQRAMGVAPAQPKQPVIPTLERATNEPVDINAPAINRVASGPAPTPSPNMSFTGKESAQVARDLSEQDIQSFRELASGAKQFKDVQDLNLAAEEAKKQEIARQSDALKTFQGRAGQLRELFGKRQAYGSGASTLDSLLLQRTGNLQNLLGQTKGISEGVKQQVTGTREQANQQLANLLDANRQVSQGLQQEVEGGRSGVISGLETKAEQEKVQRQKLINEFLNPQVQQEQAELDEILGYYSGEATRRRAIDAMRGSLGGMLEQTVANQLASDRRNSAISNVNQSNFRNNPLYQQYKSVVGSFSSDSQDFENFKNYLNQQTRTSPVSTADARAALENYVKTGQGLSNIRIEDDYGYMQPAVRAALGFTGGQDLATLQNIGLGGQAQSSNPYTGRIFDAYQFNLNALEAERAATESRIRQQRDNVQKQLEAEIAKQTGVAYPQFSTGGDISRETLASDLDRARYLALSKLAGKQAEELAPEQAQNVRLANVSNITSLVQALRDRFGRRTTGQLTNPVTGQSSVGMAGPVVNIG